MTTVRIIKRVEAIRELATGWLNETTGQHHKHASGAWAAVQRRAKGIVKSNPGVILMQTITWTPRTKIGTAIAKSFNTINRHK